MPENEFLESAYQSEKHARELAEELLLQRTRDLIHLQTKLKQQQDQLIHSEKMATLGQMVANMIHEINNPIGYVISNIDRLREYALKAKHILESYDAFLDTVEAQGVCQKECKEQRKVQKEIDYHFMLKDAQELIKENQQGLFSVRNLVSVLRNYSHFHHSGLKRADVNECIETALKYSSFEIKNKANVQTDLKPLPDIYCYPDPLIQAFTNLLVNASQSIPKHGTISIRSYAQEDGIVVEIQDNGCGIPEDNFQKLFSPFFTTKPVGIGTGLGLSITKDIINNHHGKITVESKVGEGTLFKTFLPLNLNPPLSPKEAVND